MSAALRKTSLVMCARFFQKSAPSGHFALSHFAGDPAAHVGHLFLNQVVGLDENLVFRLLKLLVFEFRHFILDPLALLERIMIDRLVKFGELFLR